MKLHGCTINRYLKKGTKLGWCNYNPKEEQRKCWVAIGNLNVGSCKISKPVEIFKDGKSLGRFKSISELSRQSEKLFNVKLYSGSISSACKQNKEYKEHKFKFINNNDNIQDVDIYKKDMLITDNINNKYIVQ
jgi:hypothetical protein